jgi:hypothetical protein
VKFGVEVFTHIARGVAFFADNKMFSRRQANLRNGLHFKDLSLQSFQFDGDVFCDLSILVRRSTDLGRQIGVLSETRECVF